MNCLTLYPLVSWTLKNAKFGRGPIVYYFVKKGETYNCLHSLLTSQNDLPLSCILLVSLRALSCFLFVYFNVWKHAFQIFRSCSNCSLLSLIILEGGIPCAIFQTWLGSLIIGPDPNSSTRLVAHPNKMFGFDYDGSVIFSCWVSSSSPFSLRSWRANS